MRGRSASCRRCRRNSKDRAQVPAAAQPAMTREAMSMHLHTSSRPRCQHLSRRLNNCGMVFRSLKDPRRTPRLLPTPPHPAPLGSRRGVGRRGRNALRASWSLEPGQAFSREETDRAPQRWSAAPRGSAVCSSSAPHDCRRAISAGRLQEGQPGRCRIAHSRASTAHPSHFTASVATFFQPDGDLSIWSFIELPPQGGRAGRLPDRNG